MQNNLSNNQAANSNLTASAIRESVFAGIIAFALFFFFIGLETTQNIRNDRRQAAS
jgi:branched-chain amino acid transport system permease protein